MIFLSPSRVLIGLLVIALPLSLSAETLTREATYYSDSFDGGRTANGDTFDQQTASAAICGIALDQYLYVSRGSTGVVIDANDRPNCARYPQVIDLSRETFRLFAPLSSGRIADMGVTPLGASPTTRAKGFLKKDSFAHLDIILDSDIPTVLFSGEGQEIRGRVTRDVTHVLFYARLDGAEPVSFLVPVAKDRTFRGYMRFPDGVGDIVFIIASGNSFDTDRYASLALIEKGSLIYPTLPIERLRWTPRVETISGTPVITLPRYVTADIVITQGSTKYERAGNALIFSDLPLRIGEAQVSISGYRGSTASSLDRSAYYPSLFSGTVLLDRKHDSIGRDKISIQQKNTLANFRFKAPTDIKIRKNYYITRPNGSVSEETFDRSLLDGDTLKLGAPIRGSVPMPTSGTYLLEIVREDGIAYANIPMTKGQVWPIIEALTPEEISSLRRDTESVRRDTLTRINTLRKQVGGTPLILDKTLSKIAEEKVSDMIKRNYQGHADPDGRYIDAIVIRLGLSIFGSLGENIGYGSVSDLALQDGLEESGVHRINMQNPLWKKVGIGYRVQGDRVYLVHIFGE